MPAPTPEQLAENRRAFEEAKQEAETTGGMVCGTILPDGRPCYYVVPSDSDDLDLVKRAFALKNGREMTQGEQLLVEMARQRIGALARKPEAPVAG